ncbi:MULTISPECIES: hypothetical protein [Pseudomonas]|uniref:hypothetical protein n=1 Tax=Pseudomonas TaxID=286 RepID=UPI001CECAA98|nr:MULTISPECIES: hypothetical protein [Pseudomonas]
MQGVRGLVFALCLYCWMKEDFSMRNPLLRTLALSTLFSASLASATDGKTLATAQGIPYPAVIAHRGASYDAPESTTPTGRGG